MLEFGIRDQHFEGAGEVDLVEPRKNQSADAQMVVLAVLKEHTIPAKFYHSERKKTQGGSDATHQ
jgi:hypothetical protein